MTSIADAHSWDLSACSSCTTPDMEGQVAETKNLPHKVPLPRHCKEEKKLGAKWVQNWPFGCNVRIM